MKRTFNFLLSLILFIFSCDFQGNKDSEKGKTVLDNWQKKPFIKLDSANPILEPSSDLVFYCPLQKKDVRWELKDVFNPSAVVRDNKIHLLYRAEDTVGIYAGTSRLGLAISSDGIHFSKMTEPVFYPTDDSMKRYEWEGGCEDPRLVESEEGSYILTYTAWDGSVARLAVASSEDLKNWTKHGLAFGKFKEGKYKDLWSKSGAIVAVRKDNKVIASKINNKYWMYWGDTDIFLASSENLINWNPVEDENGELKSIFRPRKGYFDSDLVEPGPSPLITEKGIWMIYNSRNDEENGDPALPPGTYSAGQVLLDKNDPQKVIARAEENFFKPEHEYEITGQIGNVCFLEALVPFDGKWFLYYGTADSKIAGAVFEE